jgi:hypothetical protein
LIREACTDQKLWIAYITMQADKALRDILSARTQLSEFVLILSGAKHKSDELAQAGDPISFEEYHTKLFQIGTGWLGWTPEATWNATPAEIINAHTGRRAMLTALFGGKRDDDQTIERKDGKLDSSVRAELNALGDLGVVSLPRAR